MPTPRTGSGTASSSTAERAEALRSRGPAAHDWAAVPVFVPAALLYAATANRVVGFIDRGELAAVAVTLGIAHPTGYPLLTLLGHLVARLHPGSPILALNLFAALLCAAGAALVTRLAGVLLARAGVSAAGPRAVAAAGAALLLATAPPWWLQANGFEAYALHALLLPLVLVAWFAWTARAERGDRGAARHAALFGYVYGLAFANHMTSVLIAPALAVDLLWRRQPWRARLRESALAAAGFALGLTPYAMLVLRARQGPRFSWGDPGTVHQLLDHVTAREFRGWMFESAGIFAQQSAYLAHLLPRAFAWVGLALAIAGLLWLFAHRARIGVFVTLLFGAGATYACGYGIRDIDAYFMAPALATALAAAFGFAWLARALSARLALAVAAAAVLANGIAHHGACDESRLTLAHDLVTEQIGALPPRAVLLTTQWDHALSASYYRQQVEGFRPDVTVIDTKLFENPWYVRELGRRDPALLAAVRPEADRFLAAARPFVEGRPYDATRIMAAYAPLAEELVRRAIAAGRPVFATPEVGAPFTLGQGRVPAGLAERITRDTTYVPLALPDAPVPPWPRRLDVSVATSYALHAGACGARARYEALCGHEDRARAWLDRALAFAPPASRRDLPPQPLDGQRVIAEAFARFEALREARHALGP